MIALDYCLQWRWRPYRSSNMHRPIALTVRRCSQLMLNTCQRPDCFQFLRLRLWLLPVRRVNCSGATGWRSAAAAAVLCSTVLIDIALYCVCRSCYVYCAGIQQHCLDHVSAFQGGWKQMCSSPSEPQQEQLHFRESK
jgi:hypothetical protein